MEYRATFKEASIEDIEEMLTLLQDNRFLPHMSFLLKWTEGKDNVRGSHSSVLGWMRYYKSL